MFLLWLRIAAGLYGVASILAIPAVLGNRPRGHRYCLPVAMGGWFFHLVATVEMLALHGQGRHDQVPALDVGLLKLVGRSLSGGDPHARADEAQVREFFAPYGEWAGLAVAHTYGL